MPVIKIQVRNKVPKVISQTPLPEGWKDPRFVVCYNGWDENTYTIKWDLDKEWTKFEHLTMHVTFPDDTSTDVLFKGNTCPLPPIQSPGNTYVGLYAGNIHSTTPAKLCAMRSTLSKGGFPPKTDAYLDVLNELEGKLDKNQGAENAGKALVVGDDGGVVPGEAQGGGSDISGDDILSCLIDANMLAAVTADGKVLTDDSGKVLLM